jgi:hypothetical protein
LSPKSLTVTDWSWQQQQNDRSYRYHQGLSHGQRYYGKYSRQPRWETLSQLGLSQLLFRCSMDLCRYALVFTSLSHTIINIKNGFAKGSIQVDFRWSISFTKKKNEKKWAVEFTQLIHCEQWLIRRAQARW